MIAYPTDFRTFPIGVTRTETSWISRPSRDTGMGIHWAHGILEEGNDAIAAIGPKQFIVVDSVVDRVYGGRLRHNLRLHGVEFVWFVIEGGESAKDLKNAQRVSAAYEEAGFGRAGALVGIGGGAVNDLVSFVGSVHRRGIGLVARVATTFLSAIDAIVGWKNGVNLVLGGVLKKNIYGTYDGAEINIISSDFWWSLPAEQWSSGLAEAAKMAVTLSPALIAQLTRLGRIVMDGVEFWVSGESRPDAALTAALVSAAGEAVDGMVRELWFNRTELSKYRRVDFGHAFGPLGEGLTGEPHGHWVSRDMALFTVAAELRGLITPAYTGEILGMLHAIGAPTWHPLIPELVGPGIREVTRHRYRQIHPTPVGYGRVRFYGDYTEPELLTAAAELEQRAA